ncbi:MAG: selenide, water dikinase SelD [Deinococcales bacterium]
MDLTNRRGRGAEPASRLRLTHTVQKGGCAAKIAAGTLADLLATLPRRSHPDLLVGHDLLDDAAVWRVSDEVALIHTLDFFTPVVDDPVDFGAVAAANALSDVFAMGGTPTTALTILAYPLGSLPDEVLGSLMRGATEVIDEAGALLAGGHSIEDDTLKLGFSVTGTAHPERLWRNAGALPGDLLVLTKALGTGTLSGALKNDEIDAEAFAPALRSMRQVNRLELTADLHRAVHAATDVTGFGVLGHALHMARASGTTLRIDTAALPLLPGAEETLRRGILTKAHTTNGRFVADEVSGRQRVPEVRWLAALDPQTSGGLLLSVAREHADALLAAVARSFPSVRVVGEVTPRAERPLALV